MEQNTSFVKVPIRPIDCLNRSMELVKGQYWLFVGICLVGLLIGGIVPLGILLVDCNVDFSTSHRLRSVYGKQKSDPGAA